MGDQLWGVFVTGLGEMPFVPHPQLGSFLAIAGIKIIRRVDKLGCRQGRFQPPLSALFPCFKLLFPNGAQGGDGGQRLHPVWGGSSLERSEQQPAIGSHLISVRLAFFLLFGQAFMFEPFAIALDPLDWHVGANPLGGYLAIRTFKT